MLSVILAVVALCTTLSDTWIRVFDSPDHDAVFGAVLTGPGHAIVVGATNYRHVPPFSGDALIMNVDLANGSVLRERTWGGPGTDMAWRIAPASGGGYYVFGETDSFGAGDRDFFLLKLDARGDDEWFRTYGTPKREWPVGLLPRADGGLLVYGRTESEAGFEQAYAVRVDPHGAIVWEYLDRTPEPTAALDALETSNGDLVLTTSVDRDGGLTKLGPDGHALWAHRFEFDGWQYASKIQPAEGGYLLAGLSMDERSGGHTDVWLAKASLDGELVWQKSFGEPGEDDYATSLLRLPGGEYLVAGMGRGLPRWKVDGSGNVRWEQRLDDPAAYTAFGATALADEGFLLWGVKVVVGARSFDGVLMRTDSSGACH